MGFGEYQTALFFTSAKLSKDLETEIRYLSGLELFFIFFTFDAFFSACFLRMGLAALVWIMIFCGIRIYNFFNFYFTIRFAYGDGCDCERRVFMQLPHLANAYMMEKFISSRFLVTVTILDIWIQKKARRKSMVAKGRKC